MIGFLLAKKIASMFLIIAMGFVIVKAGILKTEDSKPISLIALYIITPCTILSSFQIELTDEVRHGFFLAMFAALLILSIVVIIARIMGRSGLIDPVEETSVVYTNSGNLIIPIVMSLFGMEWVIYTSAYNIVLNTFMWTHGKAVLSGERKPDLKKIILNPNMIAIMAGLIMLVTGIHFPEIVGGALES